VTLDIASLARGTFDAVARGRIPRFKSPAEAYGFAATMLPGDATVEEQLVLSACVMREWTSRSGPKHVAFG
jgi:hypothetical protein